MPQSPELAGGEGFTFEGDAAAFYLTALLAEAYAPGIDDRIVVRVSVQQRDFGEPLDDVIVDFADAAKNPARLSLQVKRSLTISDAKTNTDFRDIIRDSWATLNKPDFRTNADRYGAAVGTISPDKERALKTLCDWARESLTAEHFYARFADGGNASDDIITVKNDAVALLEEVAKGTPCTIEEVHQFLAHFVLIQFDFLREGATDPPDAINRIRDCLAPDDAAKAPLVWSRAVQLARASAGKAGQFDRARLVRLISPVARLRGATSFRLDLDKLTELAKSYVNLIPDDIGGTRLDRTALLENLDSKLTTARAIQVRGLPGSGKSVVVRRAVQRALERGPVRIHDILFHDIIAFTPILAQPLPQSVVEFSLAFLKKELPEEQIAREEQELHNAAEWRRAVLAKPEDERTHREKELLSIGPSLRTIGDFDHYDWERLSISDDFRSFYPASPLREPFHSLFQSSPGEALRLLRELCNHAITAWRQLHRHSRGRGGTPIPLELTFPWGRKSFGALTGSIFGFGRSGGQKLSVAGLWRLRSGASPNFRAVAPLTN